MIISSIKKNYGTHSTVVFYRREFSAEPPRCQNHLAINCQKCFQRGKLSSLNLNEMTPAQKKLYFSNRKSSTRRSKTSVSDYALCNPFSQFITLTFDQKLHDSFNYDHCKKLVSKWINNQRRHSPHLSYILVAEKHKSGAIHFHMIVNNFNGELREAFNPKSGKLIFKNGKQIYNLKGWNYGFSTLSFIKDKTATALYLQKYLTKDFIEAFNKKRYWCSRGLKKPEKSYNVDFEKHMEDFPPLFRKLYKHEAYYHYTFLHGSQKNQFLEDVRKYARRRERDIVSSH